MRKILSITAVILSILMILSGCSFSSWQDEESVRAIADIKRVTDNDGNVYIEISYTDESDSDRFLIPKGVSITDVESAYDVEKGETKVTINYSDGTEPSVFTIKDGEDGTAVSGVKIKTINGSRYLCFEFVDSDGNFVDDWQLDISEFRGDDGEDGATWLFGEGEPKKDETGDAEDDSDDVIYGNDGDFYLDTAEYIVYNKQDGVWVKLGSIKGAGIQNIQAFSDEDGSGYEIFTTEEKLDDTGNPMTDENGDKIYVSYKVYSSAVKGMEIIYDDTTGLYSYTITVTDSQGIEVVLDTITVQRPSAWLSGQSAPEEYTETVTYNGDFYYCIGNNTVYKKIDGAWVVMVTFPSADNKSQVTVTFDANGGVFSTDRTKYPALAQPYDDNSRLDVILYEGDYYPAAYDIPTPTLEGYTFIGWFAKPVTGSVTDEELLNYGRFTYLTPVTSDITLYAAWRQVE